MPDAGLAVRPGDGVGHQAVRPGVDLTGRLAGRRERDTGRHGLLID
jgi:hypothetical protein